MQTLMQKKVKTDQGVFTLTLRPEQFGYWIPSSRAKFDEQHGTISVEMIRPAGTLYKYRDGVKRFVKTE